MAKDWFVRQAGKVAGPFDSEKLKQLALAGKLKDDAEVANDRSGPWHPKSKLKGLEVAPVVVAEPTIQRAPPIPTQSKPLQPNHYDTAASVPVNPQRIPNFNLAPGSEYSSESTLNKGETEIWRGRPSQLTNLRTFILCGLFCWLIVPIFVAFWRWLLVRTVLMEVTTERARFSWGVLSRHMEELELYRVRDSAVSQTFFERVFGLGTIVIHSTDVTSKVNYIYAIPIATARTLRETIRSLVEEQRQRKRVMQIEHQY